MSVSEVIERLEHRTLAWDTVCVECQLCLRRFYAGRNLAAMWLRHHDCKHLNAPLLALQGLDRFIRIT